MRIKRSTEVITYISIGSGCMLEQQLMKILAAAIPQYCMVLVLISAARHNHIMKHLLEVKLSRNPARLDMRFLCRYA